MSKHTQGPWEFEDVMGPEMLMIVQAGLTSDQWTFIATVHNDESEERDDRHYIVASEQIANARLIAAAPELLEALKETIPFMVEIAKARHHKFELHMADDDSTIGKAMRAIAKAEGRS